MKRYDRADLPKEFRKRRIEDVPTTSARQAAQKYLEELETVRDNGMGMFFIGANGTGKSMTMAIVLKGVVDAGYSARWTSLSKLVTLTMDGWFDKEDRFWFEDRYQNVDFLAIDDVGKEYRSRSGASEVVFDNLIRHRSQSMMPILLTSNKTPQEMKMAYGESVVSLLKWRVLIVRMDGKDYRDVLQTRIADFFTKGE